MKLSILAAPLLLASSAIMAEDFKGNADVGMGLYGICSACHGADGQGSASVSAPRLAGQYEWYLVTQLQNFKSGKRGAAAGDAGGAMMAQMSASLADDQAIKDVVAYIMTLEAEPYVFEK